MKITPQRSSIVRAVAGLVLGALALSACNEVRIPGVYRIDVQQGNVITQAQLAALESGMEKRKVRFILGTPLVTDTFNQDRWDYYYSLEKPGEDRLQRIISVFFEDERLRRVSGDVRAATGPIEVPERIDKMVTIPEGYRDEGLFASLVPSFLSGKPKRRPRADAQAPAETVATAASTSQDGDSPSAEVTPTATPSIEVDAEDERYLRDLLGNLGREVPAEDSVSTSGDAAPLSSEQDEEDGLLSRWAKRIGLGGPGSSDATAPTSNPQESNLN